jgi:hypothetical protein
MNIEKFKDGDIITRNEPMIYAHNGSADGSYTGARLVFCGVDKEAKIIFFKHPMNNDEPIDLSYARDPWNEGWTYFPEKLLQKIQSVFFTPNTVEEPSSTQL